MVHVAAWQVTDTTGNHNKYYRAYVAGSRAVLQYGRIGTVQNTQVLDQVDPAIAIAAAGAKINSKVAARGKHYVEDGGTFLLEVPDPIWASAAARGYDLANCYTDSRRQGRRLTGSLSDGVAHVLALIGTGRMSRSDRLATHARVHSTAPQMDVTLGVVDAKAAATLDRSISPRIALLDLGAAEAGDTAAVLDAALRLWTPAAADTPQSYLHTCLENARMVFAPAT